MGRLQLWPGKPSVLITWHTGVRRPRMLLHYLACSGKSQHHCCLESKQCCLCPYSRGTREGEELMQILDSLPPPPPPPANLLLPSQPPVGPSQPWGKTLLISSSTEGVNSICSRPTVYKHVNHQHFRLPGW